jgi:hypothetical protein
MPPRNVRKHATKAPESDPATAAISAVTLGEEEPPPTTPPSPTPTVESYLLRLLLSTPERALEDAQEPTGPANDTQLESLGNKEKLS